MIGFRLSKAAEADLVDIYRYTHQQFGLYQADDYHADFERILSLIASFPKMGSPAAEIRQDLRRFPQGKHIIYYSITDAGFVLVERVLHGAQSVGAHLFED